MEPVLVGRAEMSDGKPDMYFTCTAWVENDGCKDGWPTQPPAKYPNTHIAPLSVQTPQLEYSMLTPTTISVVGRGSTVGGELTELDPSVPQHTNEPFLSAAQENLGPDATVVALATTRIGIAK